MYYYSVYSLVNHISVFIYVTVNIVIFFVAKEPSDKWWRFAEFITGEKLRRSSDQTFLPKEIPEGVQHSEELKVAADRNVEQIKTNNLIEEPESISSQTSPSPAHPSPTPASASTSEGDKDGIHTSHSYGKEISKL